MHKYKIRQEMSNNPNLKVEITTETSHLKNAVVAVFLLGEDLECLLIVTRSYDSIRHLRVNQIIATGTHQSGIKQHLLLYLPLLI